MRDQVDGGRRWASSRGGNDSGISLKLRQPAPQQQRVVAHPVIWPIDEPGYRGGEPLVRSSEHGLERACRIGRGSVALAPGSRERILASIAASRPLVFTCRQAKSAQQPAKAISARPPLVSEVQPLATTPKSCHELDHNVSPVLATTP
jgi:hypothetical protein